MHQHPCERNRNSVPTLQRALVLIAMTATHGAIAQDAPTAAKTHDGPRTAILLSETDRARIQHRLGLVVDTTAGVLDPFGRDAAVRKRLEAYFQHHTGEYVLPGEALAAAFVWWSNPSAKCRDQCAQVLRTVADTPPLLLRDPLEAVLALNLGWNALSPAERENLALRWAGFANPLSPADSPLVPHRFRQRLAGLALALTLDDLTERNAGWRNRRPALLNAAETYFAETFPAFLHARGLIPTGPAHAAVEESLTAIALELEAPLRARDTWNTRANVDRWMEHYVLASGLPGVGQRQFLRDDGTAAPPHPVQDLNDVQVLTAHLFATQTNHPAAVTVALRVEALLNAADAPDGSFLWSWAPVAFNVRGIPRVDTNQLPTGRNLQGAVLLRTAREPTAGVLWIDAGQPFLRRGQHFDAGSFLIRDNGPIVVEGGEDIEFVATAQRDGKQRLANESETFEFSDYYSMSVAHNCMLFWDAARRPEWYGRRLRALGGQNPLEGTLREFSETVLNQGRVGGKLEAYRTHSTGAAYVRVNLARAYERRTVALYTREFVLLPERLLIVVDRARYSSPRVVPTWLLQLPTRPTANRAPLADSQQIAGDDSNGGVWRFDDTPEIAWRADASHVKLMPLFPPRTRVALAGGPAKRQRVVHPRWGVQTYIGGSPDSFERLINPSGRGVYENAWYRVGQATTLGPEFGVRPHWGRVEVEPRLGNAQEVLLIHALAWSPSGTPDRARVRVEREAQLLRLEWQSASSRGVLLLPLEEPGGELRFAVQEIEPWPLKSEIQADGPLPTVGDE